MIKPTEEYVATTNLNTNCNYPGTPFVTYSIPWVTECNMMPASFNIHDLGKHLKVLIYHLCFTYLQDISTSHYIDHIISTHTQNMLTIPDSYTKISLCIPHTFYGRNHSMKLHVNL